MKTNLIFLLFFALLAPTKSFAQTAANFSGVNGGSVIVGADNRTCDASIEGALRCSGYTVNPVEFDGTNDYLRTTYGGATSPTEISGSFWIKRNSLSAGFSPVVLYADDGTNGRFRIRLPFSTDPDTLLFDAQNVAGTNERMMNSSVRILADRWYHVLFSLDASDGAERQVYINDIDSSAPDTDTLTEIGLGSSGFINVGGEAAGGNNKLDGGLAEVWVDFGNYIDWSIEANRRKFITARGKPVYLSTDGSVATGTAPDVFLSGDTATWHTNDGSNSGFTENGALTDGAGPVEVNPGLIAHWELDETFSNTIADSAGANTGTWTDGGDNDVSGETVAGQVDTALNFGSGEVINAGSSAAVDNIYSATGMSICSWIYPESVPGAEAPIINKNGTSFGQYGWSVYLGKASGNVILFYTNLDSYIAPNVTYTLNAWQHVCFTWDGTEGTSGLASYVNGTLRGTTYLGDDSATVFDDSSYDIRIGYDEGGSTSFDGTIDDVRLYNRVIAASEIQDLYSEGCPGGPIKKIQVCHDQSGSYEWTNWGE